MKKLLLTFLFLFSLLPGLVWGANCGGSPTTYYIRTGGADANTGLVNDDAHAWLHHPSDTSRTSVCKLQSGDIVKFKDDQVFYNVSIYGEVSPYDTGTTIDRTGDGTNPPILNGGYDPTTLVWTNDSGTLYKTVTVVATPAVVVWRKGGVDSRLTLGSAHDALTANQWWWGDDGGTNYLFVEVGEDPTNNILAGKIDKILKPYHTSSYTVQNVTFELAKTAVIYNYGDNSVFNNITGRYTGDAGTVFQNWGDGSSARNCRVTNSRFYATSTSSEGGIRYYYDGGLSGNYGVISGNTVTVVGTGIGIATILGGNTQLTIHTNTVTGGGIGLYISYCTSCNVYFNTISDIHSGTTPLGISLNTGTVSTNVYNNNLLSICLYSAGACTAMGGSGTAIYDAAGGNIIQNNLIDGSYYGIEIKYTTTGLSETVAYNVLKNNVHVGIYVDATPSNAFVNLYNNTIYMTPPSATLNEYGINVESNAKKVKIANNLIYVGVAGGVNTWGLDLEGSYTDIYLDYNDVVGISGYKHGKLQSTVYSTFATWKTAVQADAHIFDLNGNANVGETHSISADPLFVSATDLHLKVGSPAINAGVNICTGAGVPFAGCTGAGTGTYTDLDGNPVPVASIPDIGAYESLAANVIFFVM